MIEGAELLVREDGYDRDEFGDLGVGPRSVAEETVRIDDP